MASGIQVLGKVTPEFSEILTSEALTFVGDLAREFETTRRSLLNYRRTRQAEIDAGGTLDFLSATRGIRERNWHVKPAPKDLTDRRVEITGPASDRRMVINALNSGSQVYMTDFEDAHSPTWSLTIQGQINLRDAVRRTLSMTGAEGQQYKLNDKLATLAVRPRGWHLNERHVLVDGEPISASLFDFGLFFFHNAKEAIKHGSGPYFYLPKMQSHLEARLWDDVFNFAQDRLGIPRGTIRATVLIETIWAAFEMDEIIYELRDHITGLNLGRWDYIFSYIKVFSKRKEFLLPDRAQVNMATHFMTSAAQLLVQTCHKRGAHALGGMSTFIPRRDDPAVNEKAFAQVRADKEREAGQGFDGAWIAHPGLTEPVNEVFTKAFKGSPNQLGKIPEAKVTSVDLLDVAKGETTEAGLRNNINVTLQYLDAWIGGRGAAAIHGMMEDVATAEISRSQMWQQVRHGAKLADGRVITPQLYLQLRTEELTKIGAGGGHLDKAVDVLDELVLSKEYPEFLTFLSYRILE